MADDPVAGDEPEPTRGLAELAGQGDWVESLAQGTVIHRYVVLSQLGAGGAGVVFAAYDPELDRKIAIKLVRAGGAGSITMTPPESHLLREAQAMARLNHPNVMPVYDAGNFRDRVFIAMEFVDGGTLRQWLKQGTPSLRRRLEVLIAAGRGLAAAHAAGLVHRDFKPDNVLVQAAPGADRVDVRVTDFGLVHAAGSGERGGPVLGTPGYMAPEQYQAAGTDARSDQFAFCATLYEALHGVRPFKGKTMAELEVVTLAGRVEPPPRGDRVPRWIDRVLRRGLAVEPAARWPSMEALLAALADDPAIKRRRVFGALAASLALAAIGVGGYQLAARRNARCSGAPLRLAGVWDGARAAQVERAFIATGLSFAPQAFSQVRNALDGYASEWAATHRQACEASARGEQGAEVLSLRMSCLDHQLAQLDSLAGIFSAADRDVVQKASEAASGLGAVKICSDVRALTALVQPPDAQVRSRVEAVRRRMDATRGELLAGRYQRGLAEARLIADEARQLAYAPLDAEALTLRAQLEVESGEHAAAEGSYRAAVKLAERARYDRVKAQALTGLAYVIGYWQERLKDGVEWASFAEAAVARVGSDELEADFLTAAGLIYREAGMNAEQLDAAQRLLALRRRLNGPDHPRTVQARARVGIAYMDLYENDKAAKEMAGALEQYEKTLGREHPEVGIHLTAMALLEINTDRPLEASHHLERALAIQDATLAADNPRRAITLSNLGDALAVQKRYPEAIRAFDEAAAIYTKKYSADYTALFEPLKGRGGAELELGKVALAVKDLERALALCLKGDAASESLSTVRFGLARALWASGRERARALQLAAQAREPYLSPRREDFLKPIDEWIAAHR